MRRFQILVQVGRELIQHNTKAQDESAAWARIRRAYPRTTIRLIECRDRTDDRA